MLDATRLETASAHLECIALAHASSSAVRWGENPRRPQSRIASGELRDHNLQHHFLFLLEGRQSLSSGLRCCCWNLSNTHPPIGFMRRLARRVAEGRQCSAAGRGWRRVLRVCLESSSCPIPLIPRSRSERLRPRGEKERTSARAMRRSSAPTGPEQRMLLLSNITRLSSGLAAANPNTEAWQDAQNHSSGGGGALASAMP